MSYYFPIFFFILSPFPSSYSPSFLEAKLSLRRSNTLLKRLTRIRQIRGCGRRSFGLIILDSCLDRVFGQKGAVEFDGG